MAGTSHFSSSHNSPFATTVAPATPTSITSTTTASNTLAPIVAAASAFRASASPKSQKALSPHFSPRALTGAAALEDQQRLREQQGRVQDTRTSPNPSVTAIANLLGQSSARQGPPQSSEQIAQMAQKIQIPDNNGQHDTMQTSPVSMSSLGSLDVTTAANASTTAPIMAPTMPAVAENPYPNDDPNAPRPAVDTGVPGDSRAFTFPPPPADDPRNNPHRNMSLPNAGMTSPRTSSTKRHKCPYCSTVFTRHHNLKSHLLTHSQEKPYECQQCQSRFRRLHDLKRHTKLHTGERPHECPKCGRKFARGDALARHNKGQGGCAGRRSSFGMDPDDPDGRPSEHMAGIEYTDEPDQMDDEHDRRVSEPVRGRQDSGAYRAGPSTYPPPAIGPNVRGPGPVAPMYPPGGPPSSRDTSSPQTHGSSLASIAHFNQQAAQGFHPGITESPKPISPGVPGSHRNSASGPSGFNFGNRGQAPQLPPLPQTMQPSLHGSMPPPNSQPGSMSSHSGGSGASGRELLGGRDSDFWNQMREMETRMTRMQEDHLAAVARLQSDHNRIENDYRSKINLLEVENKSLKAAQDAEIKRLKDEVSMMKSKLQEVGSS